MTRTKLDDRVLPTYTICDVIFVISSPLEDNFIIEMDYNAVCLTTAEDIPVIKAIEDLVININDVSLNLKTFELSTDYIKFNSKTKLGINDTFEGALKLPKDYGIIKFNAVVTEIDPIYDTEFTAVFTTMTEQARQSLLYYMYCKLGD